MKNHYWEYALRLELERKMCHENCHGNKYIYIYIFNAVMVDFFVCLFPDGTQPQGQGEFACLFYCKIANIIKTERCVRWDKKHWF